MSLQKVRFGNKDGQDLVGRLELPANRHPHNFAIFAHCFTCTKNLTAVRNISKALTSNGFGVLRFDFTGLGESDGDFENTNFSGNVEDLIAASDFLEKNYQAPTLLVGHSLGGAAVIFAADKINSIKALATIGAPSNPIHIEHLLKEGIPEIEKSGKAVINLSGRDFTIKKQFLDNLQHKPLSQILGQLRKPILILHSPQDTTVAIKNAEEIYVAARHPKSFISLDGADHLLSNKRDSFYAGEVISGWAKRYLEIDTTRKEEPKTKHQVVASLDHDDGFSTQMKVGNHFLTADEPVDVGGNDFGPSPYELVSAGLSACTAMTIQMYAKRKAWIIDNIEVHTSHNRSHVADCKDCESDGSKIDTFEREIKLTGPLDEKQKKRILQIADKCPVHKTLHSQIQVITKLID
ncbi:bifunctional alpha/beta hydrolase/OsmC family protein [Zobellia galactanivorans]|uniref:bifunctional alpha/beta hydrolase/OsmC family protein n=1 Tax=Zobellia galactanivorans (strain DSM 12802 / CCUG 47099 / CIP 106680 / NCIMB 13871 / Dsij) TaxID=63186 RepID=UPI001C0668EE|nr:bifunctional alpha/beta hydrolase/OsmC family protein [Zobellia galactanivorans]MBU3027212.1 bifunctional alpha/beta hydrolase/OsmC family protein [Zobellia galactanivorans]